MNLSKIEKLFRMLGSDNEHESLNALRMVKKELSNGGDNFNDLADALFHDVESEEIIETPYTTERQMIDFLIGYVSDMSEWEENFINDIGRKLRYGLSAKQSQVLNKIYARYS